MKRKSFADNFWDTSAKPVTDYDAMLQWMVDHIRPENRGGFVKGEDIIAHAAGEHYKRIKQSERQPRNGKGAARGRKRTQVTFVVKTSLTRSKHR